MLCGFIHFDSKGSTSVTRYIVASTQRTTICDLGSNSWTP